jgi:alpha,alpha-trehalose-phosphate synthase [UDP-forming]
MTQKRRLIVVSNRLPVTLEEGADGIEVQPSCGGLVSALLPIFRDMGGCWIGWPGTTECSAAVSEVLRRECGPDYSLEPVHLSAKERALFYQGCANEVIWPLFHDLQSRCRFDPSFWQSYCEVNSKFADVVESVAKNDDFVWVHDYHLMMMAEVLRQRGVQSSIAYFHHIPFPSPDIFEKLPWRKQILQGLLSFDTLGFQSDRDRRNFIACAKREFRGVQIHRAGSAFQISMSGRRTLAGTFPISIDYKCWSEAARLDSVTRVSRELRHSVEGRKLIVGIDRLDYTKGIPERLLGFASLLKENPGLRKEVSLVQVVVPSREEIRNYSELREVIERRIGEINGMYGSPDWCPVTYMHKTLSNDELLALYRAADVMLVTPLKDGMNLVAKEYCAARNDESGALILSEFAGAAAELRVGALLVNPYDSESISSALKRVFNMDALTVSWRMRQMRQVIKNDDVFAWRDRFLGAALASDGEADLERLTPPEELYGLSAGAM